MGYTTTHFCDVCKKALPTPESVFDTSRQLDKVRTLVNIQIGREPSNMEVYKHFEVCNACLIPVKQALRMDG